MKTERIKALNNWVLVLAVVLVALPMVAISKVCADLSDEPIHLVEADYLTKARTIAAKRAGSGWQDRDGLARPIRVAEHRGSDIGRWLVDQRPEVQAGDKPGRMPSRLALCASTGSLSKDILTHFHLHACRRDCPNILFTIYPPPERTKPLDSRHARWNLICGDYPRFYQGYKELLGAIWPGVSYLLWIFLAIVIAKWFVVYLFLKCPGKAALSLLIWILLLTLFTQAAAQMVYYYYIYGLHSSRFAQWSVLLSVQICAAAVEWLFLKWVFSLLHRRGSWTDAPSGPSILKMVLVAYALTFILVPVGMFVFSEEMCVWEQSYVGPIRKLDYQNFP